MLLPGVSGKCRSIEDGHDPKVYFVGAAASRVGEDRKGWLQASRLWLARVVLMVLTVPPQSVEGAFLPGRIFADPCR